MNVTRTCPVAICVLLACSHLATAQSAATSFEQLRVLVRPGDTVNVRDSAGAETTGKIASLTPSTLTLVTSGRKREFGEADVSTIRKRRFDSLGNGALWGLAAGAGAGAFVAATLCQDGCGGGFSGAVIFAYGAAGAGMGVGVDAMITRRVVIYERRAGPVSFGVAPLLDHGPRGLTLTVTF